MLRPGSCFITRILILTAICSPAIGQSTWSLVNGVLDMGGGCYRLTKSQDGQKGAAWSNTMVNLRQPFDLYFRMNFGTTDPGADGIAVILQKSTAGLSAIGEEGADMGYGQGSSLILPSIDIEFDTYNNGIYMYNDIFEDHCAINAGGIPSWTLSWASPLLSNGGNVEDNQYHIIQVSWDPAATLLSVYFDCNQVQSLQMDLINNIFGGDSMVYYGATSGTGLAHNAQFFCELYNDAGVDTTFCPGTPAILNGNSNFSTFSWSPSTGLSCTNCLNPTADPTTTTKYVLSGTYGCLTTTDTVLLVSDCTFLPVELVSFSASCEKDFVKLNWTTASELANDYYVVERSLDAIEFEAISTIDGAGNSLHNISYSFTDNHPLPGTSYYRLRQVDFDGSYTFSKVQSALCISELGLFLFPNPSVLQTHVRIYSGVVSEGFCTISGMSGEVYLCEEIYLNAGSNEIVVDHQQWSPGVYSVSVIARGKTINSLLVIE